MFKLQIYCANVLPEQKGKPIKAVLCLFLADLYMYVLQKKHWVSIALRTIELKCVEFY